MRKYPTYKSSSVDWLKEIPSHWDDYKVKLAIKVNDETLQESTANDFEFNYIDIESVDGSNIKKTQKLIFANAPSRARRIVKTGDVIISTVRTYLKAVAQIPEIEGPIIVSTGFAVFSSSKRVISDYLKYLAVNDYFIQSVVSRSKGANYPAIAPSELVAIKIPIPPLSEQQSIVYFLEYKIGRIDSFIANRQRQIELIGEQLHFRINEAITRGINPKIKYKPTEIKYVPEIPEHWDIRKFKSLTSILTCGYASTPEYVDESEGTPFLSAQNCRPFRMDLSTFNYIKPSLHKQLTRYKKPQRGDVLVTRVGAGIGQACIIDTDMEFSVYVSLTHIRPTKEILSEYIVYFFNTEYAYQLNFESTIVGGGQGNLNVKNVERYRIPLPPIEEQKEIVTYLDNYRAEMDNLISKYQKQIDLMQEYRTALISQAVTGKIDVREWQPKKKGEVS